MNIGYRIEAMHQPSRKLAPKHSFRWRFVGPEVLYEKVSLLESSNIQCFLCENYSQYPLRNLLP